MTKEQLFTRIPIFGMIHLAGSSPVQRALEEMSLFQEEGLDGVIVENYHSSIENVTKTLEEAKKSNPKILIGINILPNGFASAFSLAHKYGADFIQLDYVAGRYTNGERLNIEDYTKEREKHPDVFILGGVWPKYYHPQPGSNLENDLRVGIERAEAIVVTGAGTGQETPIQKIQQFRSILGTHPLIVGAGLTPDNAYQQLSIADGAIVGSYFKKDNQTENEVERQRVKNLMEMVQEVRKYRRINPNQKIPIMVI